MGLRLISKVVPDLAGMVVDRISDGIAEGNLRVRRGAAFAFQMISSYPEPGIDRDLLPEIAKLLEDKDSEVKLRAVLSLLNLVSSFPDQVRAQVPRMLELLDDKDVPIRINTSIALGYIVEDSKDMKGLALPRLMALLEDKNPAVRAAAALSLGKLI